MGGNKGLKCSLNFKSSYQLTWVFSAWVSSSAFHGKSWMWYLLFSFQSRLFKEKPWECVYCLLFQPCMATGFSVSLILKAPFHAPQQGPLGQKHFPHILLMYLSSWLYLYVCFQNTTRYNLHNLEACISVHYAKVYIYTKICLPFPAGIKLQRPALSRHS